MTGQPVGLLWDLPPSLGPQFPSWRFGQLCSERAVGRPQPEVWHLGLTPFLQTAKGGPWPADCQENSTQRGSANGAGGARTATFLLFSTLEKILLNSWKEEVPWSLRLDHKRRFILSKASTSVPTSVFDLGFSILYDSTEPECAFRLIQSGL